MVVLKWNTDLKWDFIVRLNLLMWLEILHWLTFFSKTILWFSTKIPWRQLRQAYPFRMTCGIYWCVEKNSFCGKTLYQRYLHSNFQVAVKPKTSAWCLMLLWETGATAKARWDHQRTEQYSQFRGWIRALATVTCWHLSF